MAPVETLATTPTQIAEGPMVHFLTRPSEVVLLEIQTVLVDVTGFQQLPVLHFGEEKRIVAR